MAPLPIRLSVIVLAWNGMAYLDACLDAVMSQQYPAFEVIVVDNGSTDGSADGVAARFPRARLIRHAANLGFSAGNNAGLRAADGDVRVLLNQDTEVRPGWLAALAAAFASDAMLGIAGSKAMYPDGRIQHAGGYLDDRGEGHHDGQGETDLGQWDTGRDVAYVSGASLAISRRALQAAGGLDEGFTPAYYEDVDWCCRVRRAGFAVRYVPESQLVHRESSTLVDATHQGMYIPHRNRLRLVLKHWSLADVRDRFAAAESGWLSGLSPAHAGLVAAVQRAYLHHLLHLGDIMAWRRAMPGGTDGTADEEDALAGVLLRLRRAWPWAGAPAR